MSRLLVATSLLLCGACTITGVVQPRDSGVTPERDAGRDAGPPPSVGCEPAQEMTTWRVLSEPSTGHVVDGAFTDEEWDGVEPLEGLYTDVYLDVRDGFLYVLNDWRANTQGLLPSCFNEFQLSINRVPVTVRVFMSGRAEVDGMPIAAEGAFSFAPSARWPVPHTIYEFRIPVPFGTIHVCCLDPLTRMECDQLTAEPMVFTIESRADLVRARRSEGFGGDVAPVRLGEGDACGDNQGVCVEGLSCVDRRCVPRSPDGGVRDAGPPTDAGDAGPDPGDDDAGMDAGGLM